MISAYRAWLAPATARIQGTLSSDRAFGYFVNYGNVGKEPALGFVAQEDIGTIDGPKPQTSWYTVFSKELLMDVCKRTQASDLAAAIYPSGSREYTYSVSTDDFKVTPGWNTKANTVSCLCLTETPMASPPYSARSVIARPNNQRKRAAAFHPLF
jgi:hypothetical protein